MKNTKLHITKCILVLILLTAILPATGCDSAPHQEIWESYQDIPGITDAQTQAISRLRESHSYFIYGMLHNDETFYTVGGEVVGFTARMCEWLTHIFGIPFIPVVFEDLPSLMAGLADGSVHFTGQFPRTSCLETVYNMTNPISMRSVAMVLPPTGCSLESIIQECMPRFAFSIGSVLHNVLADAGTLGAFEYTHVPIEDAPSLLLGGQVDAFIGDGILTHTIAFPGFRVETLYPFIFAFSSFAAQDAALFPIVDVVQKALDNGGMTILGDLFAQGMEEVKRHRVSLSLTDAEREFIQTNPVIPIAIHGNSYPISFFNEWDNEFQGIGHDILRQVGAITGLNFEIIHEEGLEMPQMAQMLRRGEVYLAVGVFSERVAIGGVQNPFLMSDNFFIDHYAFLSSADTATINISQLLYMRVGLLENNVYDVLFRHLFPQHDNYVLFGNVDYLIDALENGDIDLSFYSLRGLIRATNYFERTGIRANFVLSQYYCISFAIGEEMDILHSIINNALHVIDTQAFSDDWMTRTFDFRLRILRTQLPFFIGVPILVAVLVILLFVLFRKTQREENLRAVSQAKSAFLAHMSHEIRTPMNSIMGFAELALADTEDIPAETREYLALINENSNNLLDIINDILDMSKIESGKIELEHVPFDANDIFTQCKNIVLPKAMEKGLELHFYAEPMDGNRLLLGDPARLRQVLLNMVSNAVKFTSEGLIKVSSTVKEVTESTCTIYWEVIDSGIGMTDSQIARVSEPFMQADSSITRKYGGTGLGIPIIMGILDVMGSELKIESAPGIGSKFSFELTFDTIEAADVPNEPPVMQHITRQYFEGELLVCEDSDINQLVLSKHLERFGLENVVMASNGQEGVDMVAQRIRNGEKPFDLILMDVYMPVMDGLDAAAAIKKMGCTTPIVAITANVMPDDMKIYRRAGMLDCIGKPFAAQDLHDILIDYLPTQNQ